MSQSKLYDSEAMPRFLSLSETIRNYLHASESLASSHLTDIRGGWPGSWKFKCKTKKPQWEAGSWAGWSGILGHHWKLVANDNDGELESLSAEYYSYSNTSLISHQTNLNGQINIRELDMMRNWSFTIFSKWMLKGRPMISMTLHKIFWWTSYHLKCFTKVNYYDLQLMILSNLSMLCNIFYPIRKVRQSHIQILTVIDGMLTVIDFLDSCLTGVWYKCPAAYMHLELMHLPSWVVR